ncbi:reverse transcriptase domain-containing protein [Tanacetum coccineum]
MPTWCHMFNSTLTGSARVWFDDLPLESVDSYDDLKKVFLANFLQQKKCIKDPVEIHHIKQRKGESTKDFVQRFKVESRHVNGAPECIKISEFMHGITNPELIKRLHDNIPKSVDEMMRVTTTFLRGEVAASNQVRKKTLPTWKQQEAGRKQNFERRGDFKNQQRSERRRYNFTLLIKSSKEILALDKGKFKTPPPMTTPVEKTNNNKFCEFHGEAGKLSHVIKELQQGSVKDQPKAAKKGETSGKDKPLAIMMVLAVVEEEGDTWTTPINKYLTEETLPAEKEKARVVRRKSRWYAVISGVLYKKSYLGPWLRTGMTFGGNTRDLGSFGEETDKITDLHQIHEEVLFTERGDGVAGIKQCRRDLSSDGVRDLVTASGRG